MEVESCLRSLIKYHENAISRSVEALNNTIKEASKDGIRCEINEIGLGWYGASVETGTTYNQYEANIVLEIS